MDDEQEVVGTANQSRLEMLEGISDSFEEVRHANSGEEPVEEPAEEPAEEQLEGMVQPEEPVTPQVYTIKVNGRDVQLTLEQMMERASKIEAADQYLAEAARLRMEAAQRQVVPQEESVDDDLALARAIQMGNEDEAVTAIRKLRTGRPSVTVDDVARTVEDRLSFNDAYQRFLSEFNVIASDPYLLTMAHDTDAKLIAAGDRRSYMERYRDIGTTIKTWIEGKSKATPSQGEEKLERKAASSQTPKAASQRSALPNNQEPEETTQSIIADMAKKRGGPQWMMGETRH